MPVITLTTDFGLKDHFIAQVKGRILTLNPSASIVDISHSINPFNLKEAAYVVRNSFSEFPENSIHVLGINSSITPEQRHLIVKARSHFFIAADNGIIPAIVGLSNIDEAIEVTAYTDFSDFVELETFSKIAVHLLKGGSLALLGKSAKNLLTYPEQYGTINENATQIFGEIIYIDQFGNVVTNIRKVDIEARRSGRKIQIHIRNHQIHHIYESLNDFSRTIKDEMANRAALGRQIAHYNSADHLQISVFKGVPGRSGSAQTLLGMQIGSSVNLLFISDT
jgi:S-adenosylmethionine hydrolase